MCYHNTTGKWNAGTKKDNLVFHTFQLKIIKSSFEFFSHSKKKKKKKTLPVFGSTTAIMLSYLQEMFHKTLRNVPSYFGDKVKKGKRDKDVKREKEVNKRTFLSCA